MTNMSFELVLTEELIKIKDIIDKTITGNTAVIRNKTVVVLDNDAWFYKNSKGQFVIEQLDEINMRLQRVILSGYEIMAIRLNQDKLMRELDE